MFLLWVFELVFVWYTTYPIHWNQFCQVYRRVVFLVHGGCPSASITQKQPNHGQVSVHGEPKFIEGEQPYVQ